VLYDVSQLLKTQSTSRLVLILHTAEYAHVLPEQLPNDSDMPTMKQSSVVFPSRATNETLLIHVKMFTGFKSPFVRLSICLTHFVITTSCLRQNALLYSGAALQVRIHISSVPPGGERWNECNILSSFQPSDGVCTIQKRVQCSMKDQKNIFGTCHPNIYTTCICKGKGKISLCLPKYHVMKTYVRSAGIAPRILNLGTRGR
jgi:hypothetical protein